MSRYDPKKGSPLLEVIKVGASAAALLQVWATFEPTSFPSVQMKMAGATVIAGTIGYGWWALRRRAAQPTHEDWACGTYITGLPGSGKTVWAYQLARRFCENGWGWVWISIKSSLPLLSYLPEAAVERCDLFAPYSDRPRGLNLLRCYTGTATERELIADQAAELFDRLHSAMSGNMRELIRMGCLGLLTWAHRERVEVTLWELYRFFQEEAFRAKVLAGAPKPIRDAFSADEARRQTVQAVRAQLRRAVASENLLVALSQRNGIDLWEGMVQERWLVCDTPESILGPAVASFLCQVVASRVQMLTSRREPGSRPFGCFADEFQEYSNPSFAKGIATGREFGLAWVLIHQSRANQGIGKEVAGAVHLCGTRYYFQQAPEDAKAAVEATEGRWEAREFTHLPKRHYRALRRIHGRPIIECGVTPDLPQSNKTLGEEVIRKAESGLGRAEILREIQSRKVVRKSDQHREGEEATAGALRPPGAVSGGND